ncbi:MAG TPA: DMT family transporter [Stellaceae bacterium]|nr:DMT family transporter [Stellaceae bacterium]
MVLPIPVPDRPRLAQRLRFGDPLVLGMAFTFLSYFLFSWHDAAIKWLVADTSVWEILFMRSVFILTLCLVTGGTSVVRETLTSPVLYPLIGRGALVLVAWLLYYSASQYLQLAELMTAYFTAPLLVTLLAVLLLGERLDWVRSCAVGVGFTGVVIACQPHDLSHLPPVLMALAAAALWALAMVLLRSISGSANIRVQMVTSNFVLLIACGAMMPWHWQTPSLSKFGLMAVVGLVGAGGQSLLLAGIRRAPASVTAPMEFTALVWAFGLGFVIWGDIPAPAVFVGAALIIASGLFIAVKEWRGVGLAAAKDVVQAE